MELRLEQADEYMHALESATNFNESMYFNVYDPDAGVGGFFRLGNRANEGYAELTVCLYLPGGRAAFVYARPEISDNDAFDAGGMRFEVVTPFEELTVAYRGKVVLLDDPLQMADPRTAFTSNPWAPCEADLTFRGTSPVHGGEPRAEDGSPLPDAENGFARGHYEQHIAATGTLTVGDDSWQIDGLGLRDHSWGPRHWQSPWWYRWLTGNLGPDHGFALSLIAGQDGSRHVSGVVLRDGTYEQVRDLTIDSDWTDGDRYHRSLRATVTTDDGTYDIAGDVLNLVPLRNRRTTPDGERLVTRISEGLTRWTLDGRVGHGWSEYLDQIVDGVPVGVDG